MLRKLKLELGRRLNFTLGRTPNGRRFRKDRQDTLTGLLSDLGHGISRLHLDEGRERLEEMEADTDIALTNYLFAPVD